MVSDADPSPCCFRQPVRWLEWLLLPAARPGHAPGEEELQEEGLRPSDPSGFLCLLLLRRVPGSHCSIISQHDCRLLLHILLLLAKMKSTKKDRKRKHKRQKEMCLPKQKSFRFSLKKKKSTGT